MAPVQGLSRDFSGVIDAHESGCVRFLLCVEVGVINAHRRIRAGRATRRRRDRTQGIANTGE
jgi:hypothetical protein